MKPNAENDAEALRRIRQARESRATTLDLGDLGLEELPDELGELLDLEVLVLGNCRWDAQIKDWILPGPRERRPASITDMNSLAQLPRLSVLGMASNHAIRAIPAGSLPSSLETLNLDGCRSLVKLEGVSELPKLQSLDLSYTSKSDVDCLAGITSLRKLNLAWCSNLSNIGGIATLSSLRELTVYQCPQIGSVAALAQLEHLEVISLIGSRAADMDAIAGLTKLRQLNLEIYNAVGIEDFVAGLTGLELLSLGRWPAENVDGLAALHGLRSLSLKDCEELTNLDGLANLTALESLSMKSCLKLQSLGGLADLKNLQALDLGGCHQLTNLEGLANLENLQSLELAGCHQLTNWEGIANLENLQSLTLTDCSQLASLDHLSRLTNLQSLNLHSCDGLKEIIGLGMGLSRLRRLNLAHCKQLMNLDGIGRLKGLQQLWVTCADSLANLNGLEGLSGLQSLGVRWCPELKRLCDLTGLESLRSLSLQGCKQLPSISALAELRELHSLDLSFCESLRQLDVLSSLPHLRELNLSRCGDIRNFRFLKELVALRELDLFDTPTTRLDMALVRGLVSRSEIRKLVVNQLAGVPPEILSFHERDNCLEELAAFITGLETEVGEANPELREQFIANHAALRSQFENQEAIYWDSRILRVRVFNIRANPEKRQISVEFEEIPTAGLRADGMVRSAKPKKRVPALLKLFKKPEPARWQVSIGAAFGSQFSTDTLIGGTYCGWRFLFDPDLVRDVVSAAAVRAGKESRMRAADDPVMKCLGDWLEKNHAPEGLKRVIPNQ